LHLKSVVIGAYLALVMVWTVSVAYYWLARPRRPVLHWYRGDILWRIVWVVAMLAVAVVKPVWLVGSTPLRRSWFFLPPLAGIGLLLMAAGLALAVWARLNLGEMWSAQAVVREGHRLIQHGAFAVVRHPIYVGIGLMFAGTFLITGSPMWLIVALSAFAYFAWRIALEERLMREQFGEQWLDYRARVGAVVPWRPRPAKREPWWVSNMQLIPKSAHAAKTAAEAKRYGWHKKP
jgi:protein-S-isoprenylcysteine O-methyltransferase Ste14